MRTAATTESREMCSTGSLVGGHGTPKGYEVNTHRIRELSPWACRVPTDYARLSGGVHMGGGNGGGNEHNIWPREHWKRRKFGDRLSSVTLETKLACLCRRIASLPGKVIIVFEGGCGNWETLLSRSVFVL